MKTKFNTKFIALLITILFVTNAVRCQENKSVKNISILPVPVIGYSPETKTYLGAVTLFTFNNANDTLTRTSNAKIEFNYTWNKQLILESDWNYFFPKEAWFTRGVIHYSKYPDLYYGIGNNTSESGEINFQSNRLIFDLDLLKNIKNKLFFGLGIDYKSFSNFEYLNDGESYPELKNANNFGIKVLLLKDRRNNILSPTKGNYFEFNNSFNFSSSFYFKTAIDYRNYFGLGKTNKHILASRFYHSSIFGNPPFYDYAMMGGDKYVRGYYLGRFRDKNFSSIQLEYRTNLFWKIGLATFGGVSMIYEKISSIGNKSFKPNAGIGLRFLVDKNENTNLRIDYAIGSQNQSGFYISFGESF
ncbi:MAG: BamA/TamA family outer membrane protein [Mariniphaga sp.]|nr:BamA/TamA family outer membrane protein [Mariniphaga sp.]